MKQLLQNFLDLDIFEIGKFDFLLTPTFFYKTFIELLEQSNEVYISVLFMESHGKCKKILDILKDRKRMNKITMIIVDSNRAQVTLDFIKYIQENEIEDLFVLYKPEVFRFLPYKIRELFSVMHAKLYIFDSKIILSGANLNDEYFENRMDRYVMLENKNFAQYLIRTAFSKLAGTEVRCNDYLPLKDKNLDGDTYICKFDQNQETEVIQKIMMYDFEKIYMSTAYLNLTEKHKKILSEKKINIITSSPKASTFAHVGCLKKFVVDSYSVCIQKCLAGMPNASFYEYVSEGHTFHCKGLWCFGKDISCFIVGSSNFNSRSIVCDIEVNFLVLTKNKTTIQKFKSEVDGILRNSKHVTLSELQKRNVGKISWLSQFLLNKYF